VDNSNSAFTVGAATIITTPGPSALSTQSVNVVSTPAASSVAFQQANINSASDITCISNFDSRGGLTVKLQLSYTTNALKSFDFVRADVAQGPYTSVDGATFDGGLATATITQGGCYTVQSSPNGGVITGIVLGVLVAVGGISAGVWFKFFRGGKKSQHI